MMLIPCVSGFDAAHEKGIKKKRKKKGGTQKPQIIIVRGGNKRKKGKNRKIELPSHKVVHPSLYLSPNSIIFRILSVRRKGGGKRKKKGKRKAAGHEIPLCPLLLSAPYLLA